jgi:hypothetical protein
MDFEKYKLFQIYKAELHLFGTVHIHIQEPNSHLALLEMKKQKEEFELDLQEGTEDKLD